MLRPITFETEQAPRARPPGESVAATSARVAVLFGRQAEADGSTVDEIAADSCQLARLAHLAARAFRAGRSPDARFLEMQRVADKYVARVVPLVEKGGAVVGLRFRSSLYSGPRNVFVVV